MSEIFEEFEDWPTVEQEEEPTQLTLAFALSFLSFLCGFLGAIAFPH